MKILGIDLSMRSTGMYCDGIFRLIQYTTKQYNDELLFHHNALAVLKFIEETKPDIINIEELSYNSISSEKDKICGNYWMVRTQIKLHYPSIPVYAVPVTSWRNPLFDSDERKTLTENKKKLKEIKTILKTLPKKEKSEMVLENEELIMNCDIKYLTYLKLPINIKKQIDGITSNKSKFDCCDAYYISQFKESK